MEISTSQNKTLSSAPPVTASPGAVLSAHAPRVGGGAGAGGLSAVPGPAGYPAPMLDIPTRQVTHLLKRQLTARSRRLFSRAVMGLALPGVYYFLTLTSSPESPPLKKSWRLFKNWLHRYRPSSVWIYVFTDEGHGVIHMIIRMGKNEPRIDVKILRKYWEKIHSARQIKILHVRRPQDLAAYLADQRNKKRLGAELAWQDGIQRWRWSTGWLPKGFTRAFGRLWYRLRDSSPKVRELTIKTWLVRCHEHPEEIAHPPVIQKACGR